MKFSRSVIDLDCQAETDRIVSGIQRHVRLLRRRGAVVGISGGVDSAVVLALSVRAFGPERVCALFMPEHDSDSGSRGLAMRLAERYGVAPVAEDITPALEGLHCYERRDEAIRRVFPEFRTEAGYRAKITVPPDLMKQGTLNVFLLSIIRPDGTQATAILTGPEFLQIVAASNFKQRTRMAILYYHAELRRYAVIGTANRDEHDQGFFVKYGDGGVDVKAIAHLYKTQVYQLAAYLDVPDGIRRRTPTTDTYSAPASQEESFFRLPFEVMDLLWHAKRNGTPLDEVTEVTGFSAEELRRVFDDLARKEKSTEYLRMPPLDLEGEPILMETGVLHASRTD